MDEFYLGCVSGCTHELSGARIIAASKFDKSIRDYFNGNLKAGDIHPTLWEETTKRLQEAIDDGFTSISYEDDSIEVITQLKTNAAVYSAFKNHAQSKELVSLLVDESGKRRSWNEFRKEAAKVDKKYNQTWLEAEFKYATRAARSAQQWQQFQRTKDLYPNLEYLPSSAGTPRQKHKLYYGIIKPVDDPFWNEMLPPNGWGCQCGVKQTREAASTTEIETAEQVPGIPGNPGKARQVFTPDHPLVQISSTGERLEILQQLYRLNRNRNDYSTVKIGNRSVKVHSKADPNDLIANLNFAVPVVERYKKNMEIREHSYEKGVKNPEFSFDKAIGDRYSMQGKNVRTFVSNAFRKVRKGGQLRDVESAFIGIDFNGKLNSNNAIDASSQLYPKLEKYKNVKFILLKNGDKVVRIKNDGQTAKQILKTIEEQLLS